MKLDGRMQNGLHKLILLSLASSILVAACSTFPSTPPGPQIPGLAQTLAAETMTARQIGQWAPATPTLKQAVQNDSPIFEYIPTSTPVPTGTSVPMLTPFISDALVRAVEKCDNAAVFVKDVTVQDNEIVKKGQRFIKTWQFKNTGSCTWSPEYAIIFVWGDQMNGETPKPIGQTISPGQTVEISTELQAPNSPGQYQGSWSFQDADGKKFGTGTDANQFFWVAITVPGRVLDWGKEEGGNCQLKGG